MPPPVMQLIHLKFSYDGRQVVTRENTQRK